MTASGRAGDGGTSAPGTPGTDAVAAAAAAAAAAAMAGPLPPGVPDGGHSAADPPPPGPTVRAADSSGVGAVKRPPSSDGDGTIVPANASGGRSSDGLKRLWNESRMCACRLAPGTSAVAVPVPGVVAGKFNLLAESGVVKYSIPREVGGVDGRGRVWGGVG